MSTRKYTEFDRYVHHTSGLFDLLSEPNRLSVFAILTHGEFPVTQIHKCLTLPQNLVSHHLKVLRDKQLVKSKRKGRQVYYSLNAGTLRQFKEVLEKVMRPLATKD